MEEHHDIGGGYEFGEELDEDRGGVGAGFVEEDAKT